MWTCLGIRVELFIWPGHAMKCSHPGDCTEEVADLMALPYIRDQLDKLDALDVRKELAEYGAWEDCELNDSRHNLERIVWLAAGDIAESIRSGEYLNDQDHG